MLTNTTISYKHYYSFNNNSILEWFFLRAVSSIQFLYHTFTFVSTQLLKSMWSVHNTLIPIFFATESIAPNFIIWLQRTQGLGVLPLRYSPLKYSKTNSENSFATGTTTCSIPSLSASFFASAIPKASLGPKQPERPSTTGISTEPSHIDIVRAITR